MPSNLESLILDGLAFNDETNLAIEGGTFVFTPAKKQPQWIDNPDADGAALAYEPNYTNAEFAFSVRIVPKATMDLAQAAFGEIQAKLQKASQMRDQGGLAMPWTAAGSSRTYTWYALLGEVGEIPITQSGDLAGWFINAPLIPVKIICRPFGYAAERVVLTPATNATPLQVVELKEVGGDVPAEGRMILTDKSAIDRRHLEWGLDQSTGSLLITAASLSLTGFTGVVTTRSGAYSAEKVVRATAYATPAVMCGTGPIASVGSYRPKARVYATDAAARFRVSYRCGDGSFKALPWIQPRQLNNFVEIDFGEISLDLAQLGAQQSEVRVEVKTTGTNTPVDVNYFELIPTTNGYGKARAPATTTTASELVAQDALEQAAGALTGKTLVKGGTYEGSGSATDFAIDTVGHTAQRSAISDGASLVTGPRYVWASTPSLASLAATIYVKWSAAPSNSTLGLGLIARRVNSENFLAAEILPGPTTYVAVTKVLAGVPIALAKQPATFEWPVGEWFSISVWVTPTGAFTVWAQANFWYGQIVTGTDPDLATGKPLATGKVGFFDRNFGVTASVRNYDAFSVEGVVPSAVCRANRNVEVRADSVQRQDATGTIYGAPPSYRGARLFVPTGTSRLAVKSRRTDVDEEADLTVTDNQELEVRVAERFLAPR
jgi:hypothetical protein